MWLQQGVGDKNMFVKAFEERVKDCYLQEWQGIVSSSGTLRLYSKFKSDLKAELYLQCINSKKKLSLISKFRAGNHGLNVQLNKRNSSISPLCTLCQRNGHHAIEDEFHVLCMCAAYEHIRCQYFDVERIENESHFYNIMSCKNTLNITKLCNFLNNAFDIRKELLSM